MHAPVPRPINSFVAALFVASLLPGAAAAALAGGSAETDAYLEEIDAWKAKRLESLKSQEGYLTLAGLFPLAEGRNPFGSAADNALVFPAGAPPHAGVFVLDKGAVTLEVTAGVEIASAGEPVSAMPLGSDVDEETTMLEMGSFRFYVIDRSGDLYIRLKDLDSELLKHFDGIDCFPADSAWRIEGRLEVYDPPRTIRIPNVLGGEFEELCPGRVVFEVRGEKCSLEPVNASGGRLFFVFGDDTSGLETYGGGRFLVADGPSGDGTIVLDFNKAYNPPCAFSPFATCPLPHETNRLTVRIEAGEKTWGEGH